MGAIMPSQGNHTHNFRYDQSGRYRQCDRCGFSQYFAAKARFSGHGRWICVFESHGENLIKSSEVV